MDPMRDLLRPNLILFLVLLLGLFAVIMYITTRIARGYREEIATVESVPPPKDVSTVQTTRVRKITVKKPGDGDGCTEISNDGSVLVYETCGENLATANRLNNTDLVWKIMKSVTAAKGSPAAEPGSYQLTVELDNGSTYTIYINPGDTGHSPVDQEVIRIITDITDSLPTPVPTNQPSVISPSDTPIIYVTLTPTPFLINLISPTTIPTGPAGPKGSFTCNFFDTGTGGRKPYRVSNVVCSDDPKGVE